MKMPRMSVRTRIAAAAVAAALAGGATLATAGPAAADDVTPAQLMAAGWRAELQRRVQVRLDAGPPGRH